MSSKDKALIWCSFKEYQSSGSLMTSYHVRKTSAWNKSKIVSYFAQHWDFFQGNLNIFLSVFKRIIGFHKKKKTVSTYDSSWVCLCIQCMPYTIIVTKNNIIFTCCYVFADKCTTIIKSSNQNKYLNVTIITFGNWVLCVDFRWSSTMLEFNYKENKSPIWVWWCRYVSYSLLLHYSHTHIPTHTWFYWCACTLFYIYYLCIFLHVFHSVTFACNCQNWIEDNNRKSFKFHTYTKR